MFFDGYTDYPHIKYTPQYKFYLLWGCQGDTEQT